MGRAIKHLLAALWILVFAGSAESGEFKTLFPFGAASYCQRGVLTFNGGDIAVTVSVKNLSDGGTALLLECGAGSLAKISVDSEGKVSYLKAGLLSERVVRKFVLRDLLVCIGAFRGGGTAYCDADGRVRIFRTDSMEARFSGYSKFEGSRRIFPVTTEIDGESYKLKLRLVEIFDERP